LAAAAGIARLSNVFRVCRAVASAWRHNGGRSACPRLQACAEAMRAMRYLAISFLAALGWATPADAAVAVTFVHPETSTDAGLYRAYGPRSREPAMEGIRRYLEGLGERALAPDQRLSIEVLDIDLAGRFESWRPAA